MEHYKHAIDVTNAPYYCSDCETHFEIPSKAKPTFEVLERIKARMARGFNQAPETSDALQSYADAKLGMARSIKQQGGRVNPDYDVTETN